MGISMDSWYGILAPRPVVLVSTISKNGISNAAPFSFVMPVSSDPPLIAFGSVEKRHTLQNIRETGDFVINIPSVELIQQLWGCAESLPRDVSEIMHTGLTEVKSNKVKSPKIKECFAKLECKLEKECPAGDHIIVIGRIVDMEIDKKVLNGNKLDPHKANPLMHLKGENFAKVGEIIRAE
ncbi:MAG: flavin reductase family protein [Candidatus Omnitrophota bacterium]